MPARPVPLPGEVRLARRVTHPNVCRILEFGVHGASNTRRSRPVPHRWSSSRARRWPSGFARSGRACPRSRRGRCCSRPGAGWPPIHDAGIVHRDLKSENVFLVGDARRRARAVVMDFGLARAWPTQSRPRFTWPRRGGDGRLHGARADSRGKPPARPMDIYALGVVLFEMLTGRLPFSGTSAIEVAVSRLHAPAPAPSSLVPELPARWDLVVGRCLERTPSGGSPAWRRSPWRWRCEPPPVATAAARAGRGRRPAVAAVVAVWRAQPRTAAPAPSVLPGARTARAPSPSVEPGQRRPGRAGRGCAAAAVRSNGGRACGPACPHGDQIRPRAQARSPRRPPTPGTAPAATEAPAPQIDPSPRAPAAAGEDLLFAPRTNRSAHPDDVIAPF